jgi:hypothetical protein
MVRSAYNFLLLSPIFLVTLHNVNKEIIGAPPPPFPTQLRNFHQYYRITSATFVNPFASRLRINTKPSCSKLRPLSCMANTSRYPLGADETSYFIHAGFPLVQQAMPSLMN